MIDQNPDQLSSKAKAKPHSLGIVDSTNFSPYPKNPVIARVFREIGRADELGSGVRRDLRYNCIINHNEAHQPPNSHPC